MITVFGSSLKIGRRAERPWTAPAARSALFFHTQRRIPRQLNEDRAGKLRPARKRGGRRALKHFIAIDVSIRGNLAEIPIHFSGTYRNELIGAYGEPANGSSDGKNFFNRVHVV